MTNVGFQTGPRTYQRSQTPNEHDAKQYNFDLMHNFLPFWLSSQVEDQSLYCRGNVHTDLDESIPPLKTTNLPCLVVEGWQSMLSSLQECKSGIATHKENAVRIAHDGIGRWFLRSRSGVYGRCPYETRVGDKVVALWGAIHASVLRPRPHTSVQDSMDGKGWMFVGEAAAKE